MDLIETLRIHFTNISRRGELSLSYFSPLIQKALQKEFNEAQSQEKNMLYQRIEGIETVMREVLSKIDMIQRDIA